MGCLAPELQGFLHEPTIVTRPGKLTVVLWDFRVICVGILY